MLFKLIICCYQCLYGFQSTAKDMTVQMAFIAESARLQATLGMYGIQTQTPTQVEPIQIWPPAELIKVYLLSTKLVS